MLVSMAHKTGIIPRWLRFVGSIVALCFNGHRKNKPKAGHAHLCLDFRLPAHYALVPPTRTHALGQVASSVLRADKERQAT